MRCMNFYCELKPFYPPSLIRKGKHQVRPTPIPAIDGEDDNESEDEEDFGESQ